MSPSHVGMGFFWARNNATRWSEFFLLVMGAGFFYLYASALAMERPSLSMVMLWGFFIDTVIYRKKRKWTANC